MIIKGVIEEIIYRNQDNNYTVMVVNHNGEYITAVGYIPQISEGESVELVGTFSSHSKFGEQFNISKITIEQPTTKEAIIKYLSSGLIHGIGPITAKALVDEFGEDTLEIIEFSPHRLTDVRGIGANKARDIINSFNEIKKMQDAVFFLQQYSISTNMSVKIYNTYGAQTIEVLKENPYKLIEDIDGVGFFTADKIAQKLGVNKTSEFRFRAGILHVLKENSDTKGNTFMPKENLKDGLSNLLGINYSDYETVIENVLAKLELDTIIKQTVFEDAEIVAQLKLYNMELIIADTLMQMSVLGRNNVFEIESEINSYEMQNNITMHEHQKEAVRTAINNSVSVITGGPGTGKTTIVKCILQTERNMGQKVKLLAPTGRAAKRLSESTGVEASTIHRALEVDFTNQNMFFYNAQNKLPYDTIVIDEVSMVDIQLFYFLLRAIKQSAKIILVGDKDQLPSVGAGNLLSDILKSGVISVVELTQIYRQSEDSLIITNAHLINSGKFPIVNNKSTDFFYDELSDANTIMQRVVQMQAERIPKFLNIDNSKIQVLSPMKAGVCGVDNLNRELQHKNNPPSFNKPEYVTDKIIYRKGDRVMQISNNYERTWIRDIESGTGVFNGDIGTITDINPQTIDIRVEFEDGRVAKYNKSDVNELVLSYAITIHKSQGSEFDVVIIPLVGGPPMLLTKNLLYTAVTRAKKMVVILGSKTSVIRMVKNNYTSVRYSLLSVMLKNAYEDYIALM